MQLVKCVATSRSPGCGQRIDDLGMLICGWPMFAAGKRGEIIGASGVLQQLRQLGDVDGDAPRLVAGEQLGRSALLSPQCRSAKPTPMRPTITAATAAKKVHPTVNRY